VLTLMRIATDSACQRHRVGLWPILWLPCAATCCYRLLSEAPVQL